MNHAANSISGFIFAFFSTVALVPVIKYLSVKYKIFDKPEQRKQHKSSIVRLGGLGIFLGLYISILILKVFGLFQFDPNNFFWPIFICAPFFFVTGFVDDIFDISPFTRLLIQVVLSIFVWSCGFHINHLIINNFFGENLSFSITSRFSLIFTVLWIVGMTNAINWLDGLDGLATGVVSISTFGMICASIGHQNYEYLPILTAFLGACLAFLIYNFHPAKIVMGDGGSYLLGFISSTMCLILFEPGLNINFNSKLDFYFLESILFFAVPLFDMLFVILSRIKSRKSIFFPDRKHFHHRLFDNGFSQQDVSLLIFTLSQWFVSLGLLVSFNSFNRYTLIILLFSTTLLIAVFSLKCQVSEILKFKLSPRESKLF